MRDSFEYSRTAQRNNLDIVALCDRVPAYMEDKAIKFNLSETIRQYTDYRELLEAEKPDLISICTESGSHASIALDCIRAGVNLIIEKPIALSIGDADAIIAESKKRNVRVCACHQNRDSRFFSKI